MASDDLEARIRSLLDPYVGNVKEVQKSRHRISQHIESLIASGTVVDDGSIPERIQGVRRRYVLASIKNQAARQQLSALQHLMIADAGEAEQQQQQQNPDCLDAHLKLRHLQRVNQSYQDVQSCLDQAEDIGQKYDIYRMDSNVLPASDLTSAQLAEPVGNDGISELWDQWHETIAEAEVELVQTRFNLQREQRTIIELQKRETNQFPLPRARLKALTATRDTLTQWIESSLARCETAQATFQLPPTHEPANTTDITHLTTELDQAYESYLNARQRLVKAARVLSTEISPIQPPRSNSEVATPPDAGEVPPASPVHLMPLIESEILPAKTEHDIVSQYTEHIRQIVDRGTTDLARQLGHLAQESHLLSSFPLLARRKAAAQAGASMSAITATAAVTAVAPSTISDAPMGKEQSGDMARVAELLEAWEFAAAAAATATEAAVAKHVRDGERAVGDTLHVIERQERLMADWAKISR